MKDNSSTLDVELFERWGSPTAQMRAHFEQAGLEVQAQPGPVARFVRIPIGTHASK